jgi:hypothetical protein
MDSRERRTGKKCPRSYLIRSARCGRDDRQGLGLEIANAIAVEPALAEP